MQILTTLKEKFKEEQWTRASVIDSSSIQELDALIDEVVSENQQDVVCDLCLEFLKTSPKSVIALYVLGFCSYFMEDKENTLYLQRVIEIFREHKKNSLVEHVGLKILELDPVNLYALQTLLQVYTEGKNEKEKLDILLQLLRIDVKNGVIPQKIAESYEEFPPKNQKESEIPLHIKYYQLALRRFAKSQNIPKIEEIWKKLLSSKGSLDNVNYFLNIALLVSEYNKELSISLLFSLAHVLEENSLYDEGIFILKRILILSSDHPEVRPRLLALYKKRYKDAPQLEIAITNSGLGNPKVNIDAAIKRLEKEIQFEKNGYIFHQVWGVGTIKEISDDAFILEFEGRPNHQMSYSMALSSLTPLYKDHIWVVRASSKKPDPNKDITEILLTVLKSFPTKNLSIDDLKNELIPHIIPEDKWTNWWNKAKNILKTHPSIGVLKEGRPKYHIRTITIDFDEELIEKFQSSKKFDEKLKLIEQFIREVDSLDDFSDQFKEMTSYFEKVLKSTSRYDGTDKILSLLFLQKVLHIAPWAVENPDFPVADIIKDRKNLEQFLMSSYKIEYKKDLIPLIIKNTPDATSLLISILYSDNAQLAEYLMNQLKFLLSKEELKSLVSRGIDDLFRENPVMTFWFLGYALNHEKGVELGFSKEDLYTDILYRLNTVGKLQEQKNTKWFKNSPNSAEVKKIISLANDLLFKHSDFMDFITNHSTKKYMASIYDLIKVSTTLSSKHKTELLKLLSDKLPQTNDLEEVTQIAETNYLSSDIIWTSNEGLEKQKKRLLELENERQANLVELETAREKGDLRENAEYQAAREKDTNLTNSISDLGEQLKIANVIETDDISGEEVIPGTTVTLNRNGKKETYSIMGFWDTDEKKKIIAYNSPIASALMLLKKGDKVDAEIGGDKVSFEILDIKPFKKG